MTELMNAVSQTQTTTSTETSQAAEEVKTRSDKKLENSLEQKSNRWRGRAYSRVFPNQLSFSKITNNLTPSGDA